MSPDRRLLGWRRWAFPLAAATLVPALLLGMLEGGLRLGGYGYPTSFFLPVEAAGAGELWTTNPRFGWRFFPRTLARTPVIARFRHPKPPGTFRIFVLGGSAALGTPDSAFSFGRILEIELEAAHPGVDIEVVNAAMTATNSHVARLIAADAARFEPDAFAVYLGNNEVVGPFGPGSVFGGFRPSLALVRLSLWLTGTRTGQLIQGAAAALKNDPGDSEGAPDRWRGMELFLDRPVPADDPRLPAVYDYFRGNLEAIVAAGRGAGAEVVASTVATNLADNPPFASVPGDGLEPAELERWEREYAQATEALTEGRFDAAAAAAGEALKLEPAYAGAHEILGQALRRASSAAHPKPAQPGLPALTRARDLDALRFRADSRLNEILRRLPEITEARVVDGEGALAAASPAGLVSGELLYEHVHLRFEGASLLAQTFAEALSPEVAARFPGSAPPQEADPATVLAYTSWDHQRLEASMAALMARPPFTFQRGHEARLQRQRDGLREIRRRARAQRQEDLETYRRAVEARPEALELRARYAALLQESGLHLAAIRQWRGLIELLPGVASWHSQLGFALADGGDAEAGLTEQRRATELSPWAAAAWINLGSALDAEDQPGRARSAFETALDRDPANPWARLGLAEVLLGEADFDGAEREIRRVLAREPDSAEAELRLGEVRERRGDRAAARGHYRRATELAPERAEGWNRLGLLQEADGLLSQAAQSYARASDADPDLAAAAFNLGDVLLALGRAQDAAAAYARALELEPDNAQGRANLALAAEALGTS